MGPFDSLRTPRLLLRRWESADLAPFAAMNADPEVMRYFPEPLDRAGSDRLADRFEHGFAEDGFGRWAVEVVETGTFIGFTGLGPMPSGVPGEGGQEVGWRLARAAWGQGFATEAARAVLQVSFGELDLTEVWSLTSLVNLPSIALMQRLGMTEYAACDHPRVPEGHPLRPHVVYRVTATGWSSLSSPGQATIRR